MGNLIRPKPFRVKEIDFVAALGQHSPDSYRLASDGNFRSQVFPPLELIDSCLAMRRERRIAKVAMARRLAVRLYWMWRNGWERAQAVEFGSYAGQLVTGHGVK